MKTLLAITTLLIASTSINAQTKRSDFLKPQPLDTSIFRPYGPLTWTATAACIGGQSADIISSTGYEGNAFFRASDGHLNRARAVPLKMAFCVGPALFDRIEGDLKSVNATLSRIDSELSRSENESLKLRVNGLETAQKEFREKQDSNANWIRGLLVSVILLLLGFLWNLLKDRLK